MIVSYVGFKSPLVLITLNSTGNSSIPSNFHFNGIAQTFFNFINFF